MFVRLSLGNAEFDAIDTNNIESTQLLVALQRSGYAFLSVAQRSCVVLVVTCHHGVLFLQPPSRLRFSSLPDTRIRCISLLISTLMYHQEG